MSHPFLSDEWIAAARQIRERHHGTVELPGGGSIRMNQIITDVPFGDGTIESHLDTSSGTLVFELGHLEEPDLTVTTDYETAKMIFVDQDPAAGMQAFLQGRIKINGDLMKLMAMQAAIPASEEAQAAADEIRAITA
jgi:hypothetical protein